MYRYYLEEVTTSGVPRIVVDPDSIMRSPLCIRGRRAAFQRAQREARERGAAIIVLRQAGLDANKQIGRVEADV